MDHAKNTARALATVVAVALTLAIVELAAGPTADAAQKKQPPRLQVLVSNDDGYAFEGIDVLVEALRKVPRVKVFVVAPATNQTGKGGSTTDGPLSATEQRTASGYPAVAVEGTPADSVNHALDNVLKKKPNVVLSGINHGQNLGGITDISGTVGAARAAAQRGVPALAVSAGVVDPDYPTAAKLAIGWLKQHRTQLAKKPKAPTLLQSLNVPTCPGGKHRGIVETTVATTTEGAVADVNCASTLENPANDIEAFHNGFATLTRPSLSPATPAS